MTSYSYIYSILMGGFIASLLDYWSSNITSANNLPTKDNSNPIYPKFIFFSPSKNNFLPSLGPTHFPLTYVDVEDVGFSICTLYHLSFQTFKNQIEETMSILDTFKCTRYLPLSVTAQVLSLSWIEMKVKTNSA